jgi:predicted amidophosphoribosyltransferase
MICAHCGRSAKWLRRGLCRSCHRKLSENGNPLPPDRRSKPSPDPALQVAWLLAVVLNLPEPQKQAVREALKEQANG